jgi:hypothetical protein
MKKLILLPWALALIALSCNEDKGSYDYKEINEVQFSGIAAEYTIPYLDTLRITPEITSTLAESEVGRYEYIWELGRPRYTSQPPVVIGHERELNYYVDIKPGDYTLFMGVIDKQTGVRWTTVASSIVHVRERYGRGYIVIGEDEEGYADVDMIAMPADTIIVKGLLRGNGLPDMRNPRSVLFSGQYYYEGGANNRWTELWVMTGDGAYYLDLTTFEGNPANNFDKWLFADYPGTPTTNLPVFLLSKSAYYQHGWMLSTRFMICNDGAQVYAFPLSLGGYQNPFNRLSTAPNEFFKVYPYIFTTATDADSNAGYMFYDMDNHRFLYYYSSYLNVLTNNADDAFLWQQPADMEIIYGENTSNRTNNPNGGLSFALMRESNDTWHILSFGVNKNNTSGNLLSPGPHNDYKIASGVLPRINEAKLFAFASTRTLLFYAVDKTLYAYDFSAGVVYEETLADEITMIEFNFWPRWYTQFFIATYNPVTKGKLQRYDLGADPNALNLTPNTQCCWDGLVKIVDMDWRSSSWSYPAHP